jgi:undecaprenyl diphosphate synthase
VTDTLWPDFNRTELLKAILDYQKRDRRYGGLSNEAWHAEPAADKEEQLIEVIASPR